MPRRSAATPRDAVITSLAWVAVLFAIHFAGVIFRLPLFRFGIVPRTLSGLWGVVFYPFLHADLAHLMANAFPLFVLLVLLLTDPHYRPARTLPLIWLGAGFGTWLIGRPQAVHIGASALIFGLAAFLITAGWLMKSWRAAIVALFVLVAFGGIFYGALPQAGVVSWEGHLAGLVAGIITALRTFSRPWRKASRRSGLS